MHGGGEEVLLKDALVFLFAAGVIVPLLRVLKLPSVIGFMLAGAALGPYALGALADQWEFIRWFSITEPEAAEPFAELGVLFLLFLLGLELSFEKLWALRRSVFGTGAMQAGLSAAVIGGVAYAFGLSAPAAAAVGLALALSSTAVVMQLLTEQKRAAGPVGRSALSVLLFQDILVAPILIFVGFAAMDASSGLGPIVLTALVQGVGAVALIVLIGRFLLRRVFELAAQAGGRDFTMALTLLCVVGAAVITASAGASLALGAFLAGILLGETEFKHQTEVDLEPFKGLLLGLFFMTVGLGLDLPAIGRLAPYVILGLVSLLVVKALIAFLALRLFSGGSSMAVETASMLAPAGEFAFVVLAAAMAGGLVDSDTATLVAAVAGLSMVSIPPLAWAGQRAARLFEQTHEAPDVDPDLKGHVLVAGFGRVGRELARILGDEGAEIVALDRDAARITRQRKAGWNVFLGDASRHEILHRAGAERAAMLIVTVDDAQSAEMIVRSAHRFRPDLLVLARARDMDHARDLRAAGAAFVIPDAIEAGLQLASRALQDFGYPAEAARDKIAAERDLAYREADAS
ncbi:MAG: cation:proton antiporter [Pseudomonadota bacterium]